MGNGVATSISEMAFLFFWKMAAMAKLTKSMCWDLVVIEKDRINGVGAAIYRKPTSKQCYQERSKNKPALCNDSDDPNAAW